MVGNTVTRAQLGEAVYQEVGLSRNESDELVEAVLSEVSDALIRGETVKISSFGSFSVRQKGQRIGRNPKTGEEVPILPRKVLVFRASHVLKGRVDNALRQAEEGDTEAGMAGNVSEPAAGPLGPGPGPGRGGDGGTF
jgi:integration host factor subunit alpha